MSEEQDLTQGKDAAWWQAQWAQLKAENDVLNPALDAEKANRSLAEEKLKAAQKTAAEADQGLQQAMAGLTEAKAQIEGLSATVVNQGAELGRLQTENQGLRSKVETYFGSLQKALSVMGDAVKAIGESIAS